MNKRMILYIQGAILLIEAAIMVLPIAAALIYREPSGIWFFYTALAAAIVGFAAMKLAKPRSKTIYAKEGLIAVAAGWIVLSLVGALPFTLSGEIPFYLDAVFEMISGFTTTGSSILPNVEALSRCMLLWRSFSHWLGGMGILVFMLAIVKMEGGQGIHLLRAESPGPTVGKMVPRMVDSSKILYSIYLALTLVQLIFYLAGGMPLFDSLCNAFATAGTGGFAIKADSFAGYSAYAQTVTTVFMALFGVNFSIYFFLLQKKFDLALKNTELRWYVGIILTSIAIITANILPMYPSFHAAVHHAAFSVSSVITTTGFCTENFDLWPEFSRVILAFLMVVGASAGSTGGGLKVSRLVILIRAAQVECADHSSAHGEGRRIDGKVVGQDTVRAVSGYFILYVLISLLSILLVSLDGFDGSTTITAVLATFNNIGPGLGLAGPVGNFAMFSPLSKVVLCLDMLFGRLEIYPMLILLLPSTWSKRT
ncbi:MAG: TrkH family potassium uptake protein [Christensenellales bacterium]